MIGMKHRVRCAAVGLPIIAAIWPAVRFWRNLLSSYIFTLGIFLNIKRQSKKYITLVISYIFT